MRIQLSDERTIAPFQVFSYILFARIHIFFKQNRLETRKNNGYGQKNGTGRNLCRSVVSDRSAKRLEAFEQGFLILAFFRGLFRGFLRIEGFRTAESVQIVVKRFVKNR